MQKILQEIKRFRDERNWSGARPGDLAKSIVIEAAELLEIYQWRNPTAAEALEDKERLERVKEELADVLIYAYDICLDLGLDPDKIVRAKMERNAQKYRLEELKEGSLKELEDIKRRSRGGKL